MSSFQDWVPLLRGRSTSSRERLLEEQLLEEETQRHGEAEPASANEVEDDSFLQQFAPPSSKQSREFDLEAPMMQGEIPAASNPMAFSRTWKEQPSHHHSPSFRSAPDRGPGYYASARHKFHRPSLLQAGRHAGRSRVKFVGVRKNVLSYHFWKRDFFTSCINVRLPVAIFIMLLSYTGSFFFWAVLWYGLYRWDDTCISGFEKRYGGFVSALLFATETQQTIGYGFRAPNDCWLSAWMVVTQSVWGQLLDAITLGVIFARISHPKQRARTLFMSDSAVIARRDGVLKFMVRIGDVRQTQVVAPSVRAIMYTWGPGRHTSEGEHLPFKMDSLLIAYPTDFMLMLPVIVEHTIDERSPLYGHTHDSLTALGAEIVVAMDAATEHGDQFSTMHSYLPSEIHWGFNFVNIVTPAKPPSTHHTVDIGRFHNIEPQRDQGVAQPAAASKRVVTHPQGAIPFPALHENTLVVADQAVVAPHGDSLSLMFRVGDVYPNNVMEVHVRAYLYRWRDTLSLGANDLAYELTELDLGYNSGKDRLMLRLPIIIRHQITAESPLAPWRAGPAALGADADAEIYLVVEGVHYRTSNNIMRRRTYTVHSDVRWMHSFQPIVSRASHASHGGKPRVLWSNFHNTRPCQDEKAMTGQGSRPFREESTSASGLRIKTGDDDSAHDQAWRAMPSKGVQPDGGEAGSGPSSSAAVDEDENLSTNTLTSPSSSWQRKRSLFNLFAPPDDQPQDSLRGTMSASQGPHAMSSSSNTGRQQAHQSRVFQPSGQEQQIAVSNTRPVPPSRRTT